MTNTNVLIKAVQSPVAHWIVLAGLAWAYFDVAEIIKSCQSCWSLVIALGPWAVVSVVHLILGYKGRRRLEEDLAKTTETVAQPPVELVGDSDSAAQKMTDLLRNVLAHEGETSLYYYGAAGFIGYPTQWANLYKEVCGKDNVKLVRLVDLKKVPELENNVLGKMDETLRKKDLEEYNTWIETHRDNLDEDKEKGRGHERGNSLYDFEGAPLWKYGIHVVVFGERDIAITFVTGDMPEKKEEQRNAIIIRDQEKIAKAITRSIRWQRGRLRLQAKTCTDLAKILTGGTQS